MTTATWTQRADSAYCQHGAAADVHCCGCHSGFIFDGMTHTRPCLFAGEPTQTLGPEHCPVREDLAHCEHWYDDSGPCCACGHDTAEISDDLPPEREAAKQKALAHFTRQNQPERRDE